MPCLIVGTQTDLRDDAQVREKLAKQKMQPVRKEDGEKMAKELGAVKYVECSALTQFKLKDVFDEVDLIILLRAYRDELTPPRPLLQHSSLPPSRSPSGRARDAWCCERELEHESRDRRISSARRSNRGVFRGVTVQHPTRSLA